jgi:protein O-mannosyl-transferase
MAQKTLEKDNHFNRKVYLLIFALVFVLYGNSIRNNYALDDNFVTVITPEKPNNPRIEKGIYGIPTLFTTHYIESSSQSFEYRPLVLVTFAIEYQFFGSNPHVSHLISILLYALTCMLLFTILSALLKKYNLIFPLLIVFLFIIHPIHTEVVDNIKCRDELLSFLFGMCSLHYFLKSIETEKRKFVFLGILFLFLSLLCKKTAMLFIVIIPLTIYFFTSAKLKQILMFALMLVITFFMYNFLRSNLLHHAKGIREFVFFENPLYYEPDFLTHIPMAFYTLGYYIKLLIFPYPLCCYYGYNTIPLPGWSSPFFMFSVVFYFAIGIYALIKLPKKSILSYGILFYLAGVFPFANIIQPVVGIVGERFIYFASFGFCIAAAYLLLTLFKIDVRANSKFKAALVFILLVYSSLTIARNTKWKDMFTLFRNDVQHFENSCNLHYLIADNLYPKIFSTPNGAKRDSIITEATFHFKKTVQLLEEGIKKYPTDYYDFNNIGSVYINVFNDVYSAQPYFKKCITIKPTLAIALYNFAFCYEKKNLPDSAIFYYEKAIATHNTYLLVYVQLHLLYVNKHEFLKALICDEKAIRQMPENAQLRVNLGNSYMLIKDTLKGVEQYVKAIELEPNDTNLRRQVITFLKSAGYTERADKLNKKQ